MPEKNAESLSDHETRIRALEAISQKLTICVEMLTDAAKDREARLRAVESRMSKDEYHDEDHEERLARLEKAIDERGKPAKEEAAITARLSAREVAFLAAAIAGFATGKWDWLTGLFK